MSHARTALTIDEEVLQWVMILAARTGILDSAVIEQSRRRDLKLDVLDALWANAALSEAKASGPAVEAQHAPAAAQPRCADKRIGPWSAAASGTNL